MLIDTATGVRCMKPASVPALGCTERFLPLLIAGDFWEEHCVECGAPACYATCEKFRRAADGRCARFRFGALRVRDAEHRTAIAIQFEPWGKLELFYRGRMLLPAAIRFADRLERLSEVVFGLLTRPLIWLPYTRNPIAIWRSLRRHFMAMFGGVEGSPTHWIIQCAVEKPVSLMASIMNERDEEVLVRRLELASGASAFVLDVPAVRAGARFRLFSIDGTDVPVYFTELTLGTGTVVKPAAVPVAKPAAYVKCLAWDLDNTLWTGILAEDGPDGVMLRPEAVSAIKELDRRGILNTICSKNDWEPVKEQLERFCLLEYFVFPQVNWGPKSESLLQAAKEINIGIDTFAFVDDSPYERGEVAAHCPAVRIYDENALECLLSDASFNPVVTAESAKRRFSYLAEMKRHKAEKKSGGSRIDFLRECEIVLTCGTLKNEALTKRCWELINRTNQLTLAAHRYAEDEFKQFISGPARAYAIHCKDKYGDYGIVGFIALERVADEACVKEFVMSCRVAKKLCEQSVLLQMAEMARGEGARRLVANVVPTGRNKALIDAFDAMPFAVEEIKGQRVYRLALDTADWTGVYRNKTIIGEVVA